MTTDLEVVSAFTVTSTGLLLQRRDVTYDEWDRMGVILSTYDRALQWAIGDWVNLGEDLFGEMASQAIDATGWKERTISQCAWVARSLPPARRRSSLSFGHHRAIAELKDPEAQAAWLDRAEQNSWSVDRLRREVQAEKRGTEVEYWLKVLCPNLETAEALASSLESKGYTVKRP